MIRTVAVLLIAGQGVALGLLASRPTHTQNVYLPSILVQGHCSFLPSAKTVGRHRDWQGFWQDGQPLGIDPEKPCSKVVFFSCPSELRPVVPERDAWLCRRWIGGPFPW